MTLREAAARLLAAGIEDPLFEARLLFSRVGGIAEAALYGGDPAVEDERIESCLRRREAREPMAYILGEQGFYREIYFVSPEVLIPREDTEILVDYAVKHLPKGARFADLCTGSGCIALSVLNNTEDTRALCVDISEGALSVARKNAERLGLSSRAKIERCDVTDASLDALLDAASPLFCVLCNPPYIDGAVYRTLAPEIFFEPEGALVAAEAGLAFYRLLTPKLLKKISEGGFLAYEIGYDQGESLLSIAEENGAACEILSDLSGNARVAVLRKK